MLKIFLFFPLYFLLLGAANANTTKVNINNEIRCYKNLVRFTSVKLRQLYNSAENPIDILYEDGVFYKNIMALPDWNESNRWHFFSSKMAVEKKLSDELNFYEIKFPKNEVLLVFHAWSKSKHSHDENQPNAKLFEEFAILQEPYTDYIKERFIAFKKRPEHLSFTSGTFDSRSLYALEMRVKQLVPHVFQHFFGNMKNKKEEISKRKHLWAHVVLLEDCKKTYPQLREIPIELDKFPDRQKILQQDHYLIENLHEFEP